MDKDNEAMQEFSDQKETKDPHKPELRKVKKNMIVIEQLAVSNSTVLNQELNWGRLSA